MPPILQNQGQVQYGGGGQPVPYIIQISQMNTINLNNYPSYDPRAANQANAPQFNFQ